VVYLQAPVDTLLFRIARRGIKYEQDIKRRYLERLTEGYSQFFHQYNESPLLIVNAATIDPVNNEEHFQMLLHEIETTRSGRQFFNPLVSALA
jgi:deoxyadenosine/deoxycytidine kinase